MTWKKIDNKYYLKNFGNGYFLMKLITSDGSNDIIPYQSNVYKPHRPKEMLKSVQRAKWRRITELHDIDWIRNFVSDELLLIQSKVELIIYDPNLDRIQKLKMIQKYEEEATEWNRRMHFGNYHSLETSKFVKLISKIKDNIYFSNILSS